MRNVSTIAWLTFHEARRRKMVLAGLVLGVVFLALYLTGFLFIVSDIRSTVAATGLPEVTDLGLNFLTMAGLYVVHFLTIMLAIFASVDTISGEITSHTIQAIATKPVRRWEIVLGKWLGHALMIVPYLALLSGGIILCVYLSTGYAPPNVLPVVGLLALQALVLLSLSLLGGTRLSTLTNGVVLFMLYGLAFIGSWIEQIGALVKAHTAVNVGIITSLLMPVEALWRLAASMMQPPLAGIDSRLSVMFGAASVPSTAMVAYSALYAAVILALAIRQFNRRDL